MAKRYGELADALDEIATHLRLEEQGPLARKYEIAASGLRTAESIPPDPCELDCISPEVRDSVAEWRSLGKIDKRVSFQEKRPYLSKLTRVASIGPKRAEKIHNETGAETLDDLRDVSDELESVHGIGPKTATTIRRSVAQLE
jgi:DNA polymerase IV (family X)